MIRFGKRTGERLIPVKLGARLTEIGTLEIWAESKVSDNRWRLQFELRKKAAAAASAEARRGGDQRGARSTTSKELIRAVFSPAGDRRFRPRNCPAKLEQTLGLGKNSWPLGAIRQLADAFLEAGRRAARRARRTRCAGSTWAASACAPASAIRATTSASSRRGASTLPGLQFANQVQNEIEWWIFWGRVAGGLNRNQQVDIYQRLSPVLLPRGEEAAARQPQPAARDVAHGGEPGTAAGADEDGTGRRGLRRTREVGRR